MVLATGLLCLAAWAQSPPVQVVLLSPVAGQTPADIALEQAPPGISYEQFLLALLRLNPQLNSTSQSLQNSLKLQLPSAAQAGAVTPEQARAQLMALRSASANTAAASAALPSGSAPAATLAAEAASEPQSDASAARAAVSKPTLSPEGPSAKGLPIEPWMLISVGAALLVILLLAFKRPEEQRAPAAKQPEPPARKQRKLQAKSEPWPDQAQDRFRPALPAAEGEHLRASTSQTTSSPSTPATPTSAPPAALPKLSDLGPLPSLDLGGPAGSMPPGPASSPAKAPPAASAGPLDLSRISLDLNDPPTRKP